MQSRELFRKKFPPETPSKTFTRIGQGFRPEQSRQKVFERESGFYLVCSTR
jgi:hypothetical protein